MPPALMEVTLTQGQTYVKGSKTYHYAQPEIVTQKEADYLATHATKSAKIVSGGKTTRQDVPMFKFRVLDDDDISDDDAEALEGGSEGYVPDEEPDADILADAAEVQTEAIDPQPETVEGAAAAAAAAQTIEAAAGATAKNEGVEGAADKKAKKSKSGEAKPARSRARGAKAQDAT